MRNLSDKLKAPHAIRVAKAAPPGSIPRGTVGVADHERQVDEVRAFYRKKVKELEQKLQARVALAMLCPRVDCEPALAPPIAVSLRCTPLGSAHAEQETSDGPPAEVVTKKKKGSGSRPSTPSPSATPASELTP